MEVIELQLMFMGVIFTATSLLGVSPMLLGEFCKRKLSLSSQTTKRILSDASCFGAGVFLYVCFLGLLPEADKKFHSILEELSHSGPFWDQFSEFPWGFFTVTIGFLVIFSIDKIVHALHEGKSTKRKNSSVTSVTSNVNRNYIVNPIERKEYEKIILNYECHVEACGIAEAEKHHGVPSSFMFLVALGIHSVFEGVAVGLQNDKDKIMEYAVAVLFHELVMALTFGLEVSKSKLISIKVKLLYIFAFTSSIPLGIAIGLGLQNSQSDNQEIISAIIEAFATGIFLHVIFVEILGNEFSHHNIDSHKCRLISAAITQQEPGEEVETKSTNSQESIAQIWLILEKLFTLILGFALLIVINVFLHAGHAH